jgi:hypothetical protein
MLKSEHRFAIYGHRQKTNKNNGLSMKSPVLGTTLFTMPTVINCFARHINRMRFQHQPSPLLFYVWQFSTDDFAQASGIAAINLMPIGDAILFFSPPWRASWSFTFCDWRQIDWFHDASYGCMDEQ